MNRHDYPPPFGKLPLTDYLMPYLSERGYDIQTSIFPHAKFIKKYQDDNENNVPAMTLILHIDVVKSTYDPWEYYDVIGDEHKIDVSLDIKIGSAIFSVAMHENECHRKAYSMASLILKMVIAFEDFIRGNNWFQITESGFHSRNTKLHLE